MIVWYTNSQCSCCGFSFRMMKWLMLDLGTNPVMGQVPEPKCPKCGSRWLSYMKEQTYIVSNGILPVFEE